MKNLKITTAELAKICDVSQGTVDRALNNRKDIKAETKQRILTTARLYGYRSEEKHANKGQIGVIVFNLNNEYFTRLITEIESVSRDMGYGTVVMMTHYDARCEIECIQSMYNMGVCGIIICAVNRGEEFANYLNLFDFPIVAVGNNIGGIPYVGVDNFAAMKQMTEKLINDGYERFVYFSPALKYNNAYAQTERYEGFLNVVANRYYEVITDIADIHENYEEKTVIICSNDYYAMQVYFKTKNVKITGFDNIYAIEKYNIAIDSIMCPTGEIAHSAIEAVLKNKKEDVIVKHSITEH